MPLTLQLRSLKATTTLTPIRLPDRGRPDLAAEFTLPFTAPDDPFTYLTASSRRVYANRSCTYVIKFAGRNRYANQTENEVALSKYLEENPDDPCADLFTPLTHYNLRHGFVVQPYIRGTGVCEVELLSRRLRDAGYRTPPGISTFDLHRGNVYKTPEGYKIIDTGFIRPPA